MYSTIEGAKKFAKNLKSLLDGSGILFALNRCQTATVVAGGFRDWYDLSQSLKNSDRPVDPEIFRRRLISALPQPCWMPVFLWMDEGHWPEEDDDELTHNYYRAVAPYVFSSSVIHRSKSALLRPGSGPGQRLRESLVVSLLLGGRGDSRLIPRLEPDTLALVVCGDMDSLFGPDASHPRFEKDFATLVAAGVFDYQNAVLRVLPADKEAVAEHVAKGLADRAQYFCDEGGNQAVEALAVALSASGIEQATRLAKAVVGVGSEEYMTSWGPILDMFSKLAENGQLTAISRAWRLLSTLHPQNAHLVRESVPAKISSLYLARKRGIDTGKIAKWASAQPDWADHLKASLQDPASFKNNVDAMADAIEAVG